MNTTSIEISVDQVVECCENKNLLKLLFYDLIKDEKREGVKDENQNLLRREILTIFQNVKGLCIRKVHSKPRYYVSLESVLSLIKDTQIERVDVMSSIAYYYHDIIDLQRECERCNFTLDRDRDLYWRFTRHGCDPNTSAAFM